jgi:methionyl-tRNA formyltransferase
MRVFVAGSWGSMVTQAADLALRNNPAVEVVGMELGRVTPGMLQAARADILLSAAHRYFLPPDVRALARLGAIGLHPSLLPAYRGSWPLWWALRNREREVGMTLFVLDDGIDTGPILGQAAERVRAGDTFEGLYERVAPLAFPLITQLVEGIVATGELPPGLPQDESAATSFSAPTRRQRIVARATRVATDHLPIKRSGAAVRSADHEPPGGST